jgi:hypothetical protein
LLPRNEYETVIPVAVLGLLSFLWPTLPGHPSSVSQETATRRAWRLGDMADHYNRGRTLFRMPSINSQPETIDVATHDPLIVRGSALLKRSFAEHDSFGLAATAVEQLAGVSTSSRVRSGRLA